MIKFPKVSYFKSTVVLALPVALGQIGHMVVSIVDTIMSGRFGKDAVAAATLAGNLFFPLLLFLLGLGYGLTARVANEIGARRKFVLPQILKESFYLNVSLGVLFSLILFILSYQLHYFGQPPEICDSAGQFLRIISIGMIPIMAFQTMKQFIEGMGKTSNATIISIAVNVLNVFFIWLFAIKMDGGLMGIAWATTLARMLMPFGMLALVMRDSGFYKILMFAFFRKHGKPIWKELFFNSAPIGLQLVIETAAFSFASLMAGWIDTSAIAAHQIALVMAAFTFMGCTGISAAATVTVGQSFGAQQPSEVREFGKAAILLSLVYMSFWALFFVVMRNHLPYVFIQDQQVAILISSLLLIAAMFQLSDGLQVVSMGALRGMGDVNVPSILVFIGHWLVGLPMAYWFGIYLSMGVIGIWIGLSVGLTLVALSLLIRFLVKTKLNRQSGLFS